MLAKFLAILLLISAFDQGQGTCGKDWISYSGKKCFKVLEQRLSETEGKAVCSQSYNNSTLVTIESKAEQDFLSNQLKVYTNVSNYAWIGLEWVERTQPGFRWVDGSPLAYENWSKDADKDGSVNCTRMVLTNYEQGKWLDDWCQKKQLIVCQLRPSSKELDERSTKTCQLCIEQVKKDIEKQQKQIEDQITELGSLKKDLKQEISEFRGSLQKNADSARSVDSLIPLGFLYTQYPNQSSPQQLWPSLGWSDVTNDYAGLFFRAEGGGSQKFGFVQDSNQTRISEIRARAFSLSSWTGNTGYTYGNYFVQNGSWTVVLPSMALDKLDIYTTGGENRPRNAAIKIWKRI